MVILWKRINSHSLVARVSFTGGPKSAQNIINNSAVNFAEVSLELGGKSHSLSLMMQILKVL